MCNPSVSFTTRISPDLNPHFAFFLSLLLFLPSTLLSFLSPRPFSFSSPGALRAFVCCNMKRSGHTPPLAPSHGLPTPPDSPRKRRNFLRRSEDTEGYLSIEEYLYRCDPYRSTSITEPWPYPVVSQPASPAIVQKVEACKSAVLNILSEHNFPNTRPHLNFLVDDITKPGYPLGHQPITVLRLIYLRVESPPKRLGPTKDAVYNLIRQRGILNVHVEIVFLDKCFRPSLFTVDKNDPTVAAYANVKYPIMRTVNAKLGTEWNLLGLFNVGLTKAATTRSITVFVNSPTTTPDPGGLSMADSMREDGVPGPGTSIGVLPERGGGTLGLFVKLHMEKKIIKGALTNFHVVRPPSCADASTVDRANRFGSSIYTPDSTRVDVSYFAEKDKDATDHALERRIQRFTQTLRKASEEKETREVAGMRVNQGVLFDINAAQGTIASSQRKLAVVRRMPLNLGKVLVSSGRALLDDRIADWAIIGLNLEPFQGESSNLVNRMPHVTPSQKEYRQPFGQWVVAMEGRPIEAFGDLEAGEWYCKVGRTTGVTAGMCNGISTYCNWPDSGNRARFHKDRQQVPVEDGITEEWAIMSESRCPERENVQVEFAKKGDSGSAVLNRLGDACGLVYGSSWGLCGHNSNQSAGLCTTMSNVCRWVEEKTTPKDDQGNPTGPGGVLSLPQA